MHVDAKQTLFPCINYDYDIDNNKIDFLLNVSHIYRDRHGNICIDFA